VAFVPHIKGKQCETASVPVFLSVTFIKPREVPLGCLKLFHFNRSDLSKISMSFQGTDSEYFSIIALEHVDLFQKKFEAALVARAI
jgi:hypothetical protein